MSTRSYKICSLIIVMALAILVVQRALTAPGELWVLLLMVIAAFFTEIIYRRITGRTIKSSYRGRRVRT